MEKVVVDPCFSEKHVDDFMRISPLNSNHKPDLSPKENAYKIHSAKDN